MVVRPYKTRSAFTNLSSPPTIYLNKHLIDDEEVLEYLILREMIHIALHKYPQMRYGAPNLSHSNKSNSALRFFVPEEKEEKIKEKIMKKTDRGKPETRSITSFSSFVGIPAPPPAPRLGLLRRDKDKKKREKRGLSACRYIPTGIRSQV